MVTADSDFATLFALRRATSPSVVHLRGVAERPPEDHISLLVANLPKVATTRDAGAIVSLSPSAWRSETYRSATPVCRRRVPAPGDVQASTTAGRDDRVGAVRR